MPDQQRINLSELRRDAEERQEGGYYAANATTYQMLALIEAVEAAHAVDEAVNERGSAAAHETEKLLATLDRFDFGDT